MNNYEKTSFKVNKLILSLFPSHQNMKNYKTISKKYVKIKV